MEKLFGVSPFTKADAIRMALAKMQEQEAAQAPTMPEGQPGSQVGEPQAVPPQAPQAPQAPSHDYNALAQITMQHFQDRMGRPPTAQEFNQLLQTVLGGHQQ